MSTLPAPPINQDAEFSFSGADFERVRQLIYQRAGISLHAGKQAMVYSRLSRRLRETGHRSFGEYLQWLERATGAQADSEWQEFVNCLTTNLTAFFREEHHFHALVTDLRARQGKPVRIWCNAASTGEEPYSLAMTVIEALGPSAAAHIVCSDIDTKVLETARKGVYAAESRGLDPERLKRHFMRGTGNNAGFIRAKPELSRLLEFKPFNLMSPSWSALGDAFDIVFCRNVMIYFDVESRQALVERLFEQLAPGGHLFVGHAEGLLGLRHRFRSVAPGVYQRPREARA
jgi:chemotaxis protein methyltransferase CheR